MCADTVLMNMFEQDELLTSDHHISYEEVPSGQATYQEVVKDFIMDEKQFLRDLQMITKVFKDLLQKHNIARSSEIEAIFSNVSEIDELTVTIIGALEDTLEMTEDGHFPTVGSCFEDLAEGEEFEIYERYMQSVLSSDCRNAIDSILSRKDAVEKLISSGKGFVEAVKYYLPKLLLAPIYHCSNYFRFIETLMTFKTTEEDFDALTQAAAMLSPLQNKIQMALLQISAQGKRKPGIFHPRNGPSKLRRQLSLQKLNQVQNSIVNWEGKDIASNSSEIVCDGKLNVLIENRKRFSERHVFLFDGMIVICKLKTSGGIVGSSSTELRLGLKFLIRKIDVLDRRDTDDVKNAFEVVPKDQPKILLKADSLEEKNTWMASLVMLNTKSMLERRLDINLSKEETKHPLRFPSPESYKFSEPDCDDNIIFEDFDKTNGVPLIKGATLVKLVERLTYHMYADPMFVKAFLTTFRSFSNPKELLDLLIERFNIPDPEFSPDTETDSDFFDKTIEIQIAQDMKRFRKEYKQPVQFRVLNVLKHWVDEHFYDFEQDNELLTTLTKFLNTISCRNMRKWVECIFKIIQRRQCSEDRDITFDFDRSPPEFETHIDKPEPGWPELLTYHPIEIARQLTLLEFDFYRAVKPSELVDQAWMKEDKDKRSPNLLRMVRHTTVFTRYLEKLIVESDNTEERAAVIQRALEIMAVLMDYNNFSGVIAITSAMYSSSVYRLVTRMKDRIPSHLLKALEDAESLLPDHFKIYWEKLRSLNPPCVPFLGQYQTNILFLEEGNPDHINNAKLINFCKWRKVAEIISEIQQYQNQPYCLRPWPKLKSFLENLAPFPEMSEKEITEYLWEKSVELEPRGTETLRKKSASDTKPLRWKGLNLKSPGIKPKNLPGKIHPNPLPRIRQANRSQADKSSPLTSPVFQFSPSSLPPTPCMPTPSPAKSERVPAVLPHLGPDCAPPPELPPKPQSSVFFPATMPRSHHRSCSPPPLPPRSKAHATPNKLEDRRSSTTSPPPPVPRSQKNSFSQGHRFPPPLNLMPSLDNSSPGSSPLFASTPNASTHRSSLPGSRPDLPPRNNSAHFQFGQAGQVTSPVSNFPPKPDLDVVQLCDNFDRVNDWLKAPKAARHSPEISMP